MRKSPFIIPMTLAMLAALLLAGCSRSPIPPDAQVQDLGVLKVQTNTRTLMPLASNVSLYCVSSPPELLPEKVEYFATVTHAPDKTLWLEVDVVPTPAGYNRLALKHLSVPFYSGKPYTFKVTEKQFVRFTPTLERQE